MVGPSSQQPLPGTELSWGHFIVLIHNSKLIGSDWQITGHCCTFGEKDGVRIGRIGVGRIQHEDRGASFAVRRFIGPRRAGRKKTEEEEKEREQGSTQGSRGSRCLACTPHTNMLMRTMTATAHVPMPLCPC